MKYSTIAVLLMGVAYDASMAQEVTSVHPESGTIHRWVSLPSDLKPWQEVDLQARVDGYVKSVLVDKGDHVVAGQVLIEIEVPELEAGLIIRRAKVAAAEVEAKRLREAREKSPGLILPQALDNAEATLTIATAEWQEATTLLEFAQIKAPFAGIIADRMVDPGAFAQKGGGGLLRLVDSSKIRLSIPVVEVEAGRLQPGQPVEAKIDALGGRKVTGQISRVSGSLDRPTRTLTIEADLENPKNQIIPGMFATARVAVETHEEATLIPVMGLVMEKTNGFVFKLIDGIAIKTPVTPGFNDGEKVEVPDLNSGDTILIPNGVPITDGQAVSPPLPSLPTQK
jgi:RND family efflux transporter MFP subunit